MPPKFDLSIQSVCNRIIEREGGLPYVDKASVSKEQKNERERFRRAIDQEILDQVTHRNMSVWGRYSDGPLRPVTPSHRMRFDHRKSAVSIQGDAVRPMVFKDVMFDSDEVEAVWPRKA